VTAILTNEEQEGEAADHPRVSGVVLEDGRRIEADKVIVAMGPWSTKVQDWLNIRIPMTGIYSTSLMYTAENSPEAKEMIMKEPRALFCSEDNYGSHLEVYPRSNGDVYICGCGGSRYVTEEELRNYEPSPGREVADSSRATAAYQSFNSLAPSITQGRLPDVTQACMRPCPPDALPMIGHLPGVEGAYIAAGHNCWGILWGPVTGKIMSELVLDGRSSIDLKHFDPKRFGGRMSTPVGRARGRHRGEQQVGEQW